MFLAIAYFVTSLEKSYNNNMLSFQFFSTFISFQFFFSQLLSVSSFFSTLICVQFFLNFHLFAKRCMGGGKCEAGLDI